MVIPCRAFKNEGGFKSMQVICTFVYLKVAVQCYGGIALPLLFATLIESVMNWKHNNYLYIRKLEFVEFLSVLVFISTTLSATVSIRPSHGWEGGLLIWLRLNIAEVVFTLLLGHVHTILRISRNAFSFSSLSRRLPESSPCPPCRADHPPMFYPTWTMLHVALFLWMQWCTRWIAYAINITSSSISSEWFDMGVFGGDMREPMLAFRRWDDACPCLRRRIPLGLCDLGSSQWLLTLLPIASSPYLWSYSSPPSLLFAVIVPVRPSSRRVAGIRTSLPFWSQPTYRPRQGAVPLSVSFRCIHRRW